MLLPHIRKLILSSPKTLSLGCYPTLSLGPCLIWTFIFYLLLWAHLIWGVQKKPELFIIRMNTDPSVFIASVWSPVLAQGQGSPVTIVIGIPKYQQIPSTYLHFPIKAKGLFSSILSWGEERRVCAQWDSAVEKEKLMMQDYVGTRAQGVVSLSRTLCCSATGETVACPLDVHPGGPVCTH